MSTELAVNLVTPQGQLAEQTANAVTAPGELGAFQIYPGHVPFLTKLNAGVLALGDGKQGAAKLYAVGPGILEVESHGTVRILVERAVATDDIDTGSVKAELAELEPKLASWKGELDAEHKNLSSRVAWAQAQLDAANS